MANPSVDLVSTLCLSSVDLVSTSCRFSTAAATCPAAAPATLGTDTPGVKGSGLRVEDNQLLEGGRYPQLLEG